MIIDIDNTPDILFYEECLTGATSLGYSWSSFSLSSLPSYFELIIEDDFVDEYGSALNATKA